MKRYIKISNTFSDKDNTYDEKVYIKKVFSDSLSDKSRFVPIEEALSSLTPSNSMHIEENRNYDFPDGKDDGRSIPLGRKPAEREITNLFTEAQKGQASASQSISRAKKKISIAKEYSDIAAQPNKE